MDRKDTERIMFWPFHRRETTISDSVVSMLQILPRRDASQHEGVLMSVYVILGNLGKIEPDINRAYLQAIGRDWPKAAHLLLPKDRREDVKTVNLMNGRWSAQVETPPIDFRAQTEAFAIAGVALIMSQPLRSGKLRARQQGRMFVGS